MKLVETRPLVEVHDLMKHFPIRVGFFRRHLGDIKAVDGVSFDVRPGETLGLVGESGSGKTTVGRTILRLYDPTAGQIMFDGIDISRMSMNKMRRFRRRMQMIFQDPYSSLSPRMTVGRIISEPLEVHRVGTRKGRRERVRELLSVVGLDPEYHKRYPHEFSGGQRQRIGIARALALNPDLIICDEPIASLDVSVQAQVVNLLEDLQDRLKLTYVFIAHDLSMVRHISDRVAVMYLGKIVELAGSEEIYRNTLHPYTKALMSAIPIADVDINTDRKRIILQGDIPSPANPPSGCRFHTRCHVAQEVCRREEPPYLEVHSGHYCACHFVKAT